ncbi:unnamed protein product [Durusdinium trenchii]|uniref:Uncharacterized protein n=1 Tax=Durusdinium trenchii TaxID=1381693 RepID=A0ABP0Q1I5_9DINO
MDLGFSSDEEDSEDITPAPYAPVQEEPEAQNQPEEGNAENLEGDLEKQSDHAKLEKSKPRPEKAVSRVARLWDQHARAREQREDIDLSDRLEASKDYRTWVTSVDIDLQPGEAAPNFTEVWVELQNLHKRQKVSKEEPDWKWSEPSDWRHWGRWSRWKEDWDGEHKEARIVLAPAKSPPDPPVLREVRRASPLALKPAPRGDPLADFAAEASITYLRERNASDPQRRRGASTEPHRLRHHRRPEKPRGPPRAPRAADLAGRERLARACYSRSESLRIFDEALQELSARGQNELPITASVILSEIEQRHGDFLYDTPFEVFSDLLDAAAEDGMIEVSRRNRQELVTWVKYRMRRARRDEDRPSSRERERRRGRRPSVDRRGRPHEDRRVVQWSEVPRHRPRGGHRSGELAETSLRPLHGSRGGRRREDGEMRLRPRTAREKRYEAALKTAKAKARPKAAIRGREARSGKLDQEELSKKMDDQTPMHRQDHRPKPKGRAVKAAPQAKRPRMTDVEVRKQPNTANPQHPSLPEEESSSEYSYYSDEDGESSSSEEKAHPAGAVQGGEARSGKLDQEDHLRHAKPKGRAVKAAPKARQITDVQAPKQPNTANAQHQSVAEEESSSSECSDIREEDGESSSSSEESDENK